MRPLGVTNVALNGLNRQIAAFERSASEVVEKTTSEDGFEPVDISHEAAKAGESLDSATHGSLEGALVDLRISKYLAIANMKVLKTADEMQRTAQEIVR
ncbi:MAG TPA: hypothetical protein VFQ35_18040 [Polyangiaceae bacterium]|nr:hypothetical protein [Polyangiaceae bacterium]